ncbi:phosphatidylserine decarboxylase [Allomuricauda sp. SCSIO 65647]|uniref:phosphatidylserine decarboxylase n=1 Tax=Allomuricauda sp. SCSIO 65647 TaxID=2908843 RepID=UPI001F28ECD7|nr:phosphatidylserine decarboxylase [Muricauda sp. SCSIO 65647]UJH67276.1 phosphatidylserine decarboxylase [Muricauda sp. SCSIO 65647]
MEAINNYYSDPTFTVFKVPSWRARFYRFLSVDVWGALPSHLQRKISTAYTTLYQKRFSKYIISPYLWLNYSDKTYLDKFKPPMGKEAYDNFQDFFTREFKVMPDNPSPWVWPCEGLLCDMGHVDGLQESKVKSDTRRIDVIFGVEKDLIPKEHVFTNVFLHNKNYHRIHSPISGTISRIQHVPGDLVVLRPWIYKQNPSLPAFRNERYNIDITDEMGRVWYLSIVGGPAVGTIELGKNIKVGSTVEKLQELSIFYLGSTCCMAAPLAPRFHEKNTFVEVGASY